VHVKRIAIIVLGGGAVAAWFAGAATSNRPLPDPAPLARASVDLRGEALAKEIARLQERLKPTSTPRTPGRNLFTYRAAAAPIVAPPSELRAAIVDAPPSAPALPALKLSGLSEDPGDGAPLRQAFITGDANQLYIVKVGEAVTARYKVVAISASGVDLVDLTDNSTRHLSLR